VSDCSSRLSICNSGRSRKWVRRCWRATTAPLARDARMTEVFVPVRIEVMTLGEAWMAIAAAILKGGVVGSWDGLPIVEVFRATLDVYSPRVDDPIIARHGDPERLAWMHANFTDHSRVAEVGDADSYATRLYDYAHAGRDQIRWVIDRLAANPWTRDATVTTFQPLTDTSYIPCVSLLDFWLVKGSRHRLRYEGLCQPRRARVATNSRGQRPRGRRRHADDDGEIGPHLSDRAWPDATHRRGDRGLTTPNASSPDR